MTDAQHDRLEKAKKEYIGKKFSRYTVEDVFFSESKGKELKVRCRCECGAMSETFLFALTKGLTHGCADCARKARREKRLSEHREKYLGKSFGLYTVEEIFTGEGGNTWARCRCECGAVSSVPLSRLLSGKSSGCKKCRVDKDGLARGQEIASIIHEAGTSIVAVSERRRNRNSTTGVCGVSRLADGRYRAYINLKRKHYGLGIYPTLEEAAAARAEGEKRIYGDFLKEYRKKHDEENKKS